MKEGSKYFYTAFLNGNKDEIKLADAHKNVKT